MADDLAPLSDEFDSAASLTNWQRLNTTEGWAADKLETHDVDTSVAGKMRIMPYTTSWYRDLTGPLVYKEVTGDFVVTTELDVQRRGGAAGRPVPQFSLGGIMIRTARSITAAAPVPAAAPSTVLPWPPSGYTTEWTPGTENYIFLAFGNAIGNTPANQWSYEVKTTIDSNSTLYYNSLGVPADEGRVTLQAVRRGNVFVLLRKHGPSGDWIVENRYTRPDMPQTLQVGITTYTDWNNIQANSMFGGNSDFQGQYHHNRNVMTAANGFSVNPDLVVDAEYFRFQRPDSSITETTLNALALTSAGAGTRFLSDTALASVLGDAQAVLGPSYTTPLATYLQNSGLSGSDATTSADPDGDGMTNITEWANGTDPSTGTNAQHIRHIFVEEGGVTYLALAYARLTGGTESTNQYQLGDLTYHLEGSTDLETWDLQPVAITAPSSLPALTTPGYEWGCVRLPAPVDLADRGYLRFWVEG